MDIIFFAAVAVYIFFKLRSQFGKVDEDQKRQAIKKFLNEKANIDSKSQNTQNKQEHIKIVNEDNYIPDSLKSKVQDQESENIINQVDKDIRDEFVDTLIKSHVTAANFIKGTNVAFEMVIEAFSKADKKTLQSLLSKELAKKFVDAIDERIKRKETLHTNLVSIDKVIVESATIKNNQALIAINFISSQINYSKNDKDALIDGSRDEINEVSDSWTFSRDINSKNPNWEIISTAKS